MKILCAVDRRWAIGYKGELLYRIPDDLARFKSLTEGQVVVMGRKTLESLPAGQALKNRINIVITTCKDYKKDGIIVVRTAEELKERLEDYKSRRAFLIGGGQVVEAFLDLCDTAYITRVDDESKKYDTKIPNLDENKEWSLVEESQSYSYDGYEYRYLKYKRRKK